MQEENHFVLETHHWIDTKKFVLDFVQQNYTQYNAFHKSEIRTNQMEKQVQTSTTSQIEKERKCGMRERDCVCKREKQKRIHINI